jgi:transposase InsO family protein
MSDSFYDQPHVQHERATAQEPAALREQLPDAAGVGRAQRSEPERSDGERSGARPTPATSPSPAPGVAPPAAEEADDDPASDHENVNAELPGRLRLTGRSKGRRLVKKDLEPVPALTAEQRLLLLDTWQRSGLPAKDFAALVGVSKHSLYVWKKKFDTQGPAGLLDQPSAPCTRRGHARQRLTREQEAILRGNIVELALWTVNLGFSLPETANLLHLAPRTLREWYGDSRSETPRIHLLGRPTLRSSRADRTEVLDVLDELGPATSVATLRACFPHMSRAELEDLLKRYRHVWRKRHQHAPHCLHWQHPGAVWAIDFSEAPCRIDGVYPYLLAVRDLASHQQLLWLPVLHMSAEITIEALGPLLLLHGAPLVLKADNGSAFIAEATQDFLSRNGVNLLFSPAHTPEYNGAIEAGIGSLKTRTERYATRASHPGYWTTDDVAAAQSEANATARPHGETGPTPNELWQTRRSIAAEERRLFQDSVQQRRKELSSEEALSNREERRLQREPIRRALEEHGILLYSRRRIPQPIPKQKTADIM